MAEVIQPRSASVSSDASSWSLVSNTASHHAQYHHCPSYAPSTQAPRPVRQDSLSSIRSSKDLNQEQTQELWECMLDLQELYACYNSTRIDMALDAREKAHEFMPNRFIIDTLNDSLHDLPSEGWQRLYRCLGDETSSTKSKLKLKFWKKD